ncbi:reactive intermediate/imine deaminase [Pseudomonas helmanticensis]|uniref:Reactive intermediate/imine deaminase n=1 Tax=Pseudomonas helmanticensis TaxID=1471381 RepID=A0ACD2UD98_9PSED|nr:RidA family protein [Pseudomonas helmanticensis]SMQ30412.1 reactive intermediate/imine deaminase [Pseudomonas helmanticensis]
MSGFNEVLARNTEKAPKSIGPYSQTVAFSHYNYISAQLPIDPMTSELVSGGIEKQVKQCFQNIKAILENIDHFMDDIIRITIYLTDINDTKTATEIHESYFLPCYTPTLTLLSVSSLPMGASVQIEALISNGEGTIPGSPQAANLIKVSRSSEDAPANNLSAQSVAFSHYNNVSAQLPIDPKTNELVPGGAREQTRQCLNNIKSILSSVNVSFDDIVKINIFLTSLSDVDRVNQVYSEFFPDSAVARAVSYLPARSVVAVTGLPRGARVQVEAIVSHGNGTPPQLAEDRHGIIIKSSNNALAPKDHMSSQTVAFSHYNHLSAQLPLNPNTGKLIGNSITEQATQCLMNIKAIVASVNHKLSDVVKITIHLKNLDDLDAVNEVYGAFFPRGEPARTVVGVQALPLDARIQVDAVVSNAEGTPPRG